MKGGRRRPQATRVSTVACLLPRGEAEEARRDLGEIKNGNPAPGLSRSRWA